MHINDHFTNASISTMWALNNYPDLNEFFSISRQLGFQQVELNHQIDSAMLAGIELDHYSFSSIHEPCPADISVKKLLDRDWIISSIDETSRRHGVEAIKNSIQLAHKLGAPVVVIHCGIIPVKVNHEGRLRVLFNCGEDQSEEYIEIKKQFIKLRESLIAHRLESVKKSIKELLEYAAPLNIKLGLENRYHYLDIPSMNEMGELLGLANESQLGFIYDVGHAQALDSLGFYPHEEWLKRYSSRMFGCHLHDVIGITDHYAPGLGTIDFKMIANYLAENAFRTVEVLPGNTLAQVKNGLSRLVDTGCIRYL